MGIEYKGIKFDTVEELVEYQKKTGELEKTAPQTNVTNVELKPKRKKRRKGKKQKPWTKKDEQLVESIWGMKSKKSRLKAIKKFARDTGRTRGSIYARAYKKGLKVKR